MVFCSRSIFFLLYIFVDQGQYSILQHFKSSYFITFRNFGTTVSLTSLLKSFQVAQYPPWQQSHKKRKLSGQQDFCRKNFPDKVRKSSQFSNSRQMRIKGGFARFCAEVLSLDYPDTFLNYPDTLRIVRKLSRSPWHISRSSGLFLDYLDTFLR